MSVQLLDRTRKIGQLLHNNRSAKVVFNDICSILTDVLSSNVLIFSRKGKVLGACRSDQVEELTQMLSGTVGSFIDPMLNERFLTILSTKENVNLQTLGFSGEKLRQYQAIVTPIDIAGERLGTVFMYRMTDPYEIDDIILAEYGTTIVSMAMMRAQSEESEEELRKKQVVTSALSTLSESELEAILHIFDVLEDSEGLLVASRIADHAGITRSVIVNAIRKFESAGVIEARSSGMKGTYIKVINDAVYGPLEEIRNVKNAKKGLQ